MSRPVLFIHTRIGCSACSTLLEPKNYNNLLNLVRKANPETIIRIIKHPGDWEKNNTEEKYVNIGIIKWAPTYAITSENNSGSDGDPSKVDIFRGKSNPTGKVLPVSTQIGLQQWLNQMLDSNRFKPNVSKPETQIDQREVEKLVSSVQNETGVVLPPSLPKNDTQRICHSFRMVAL